LPRNTDPVFETAALYVLAAGGQPLPEMVDLFRVSQFTTKEIAPFGRPAARAASSS